MVSKSCALFPSGGPLSLPQMPEKVVQNPQARLLPCRHVKDSKAGLFGSVLAGKPAGSPGRSLQSKHAWRSSQMTGD